MTATVTNKADDRQLIRLAGDELATNLLHARVVCATDYACIVAEPGDTERRDPNETVGTVLTDDVFALLLRLQNLSDRVSASSVVGP